LQKLQHRPLVACQTRRHCGCAIVRFLGAATEVSCECGEVQVESVGGEQRKALRCEGAHELDLQVVRQPSPDFACSFAQGSAQFIELQMWAVELMQTALVQLV
jgi:hypothetical protein